MERQPNTNNNQPVTFFDQDATAPNSMLPPEAMPGSGEQLIIGADIALSGIRASINEVRADRAEDRLEKLEHRQAFYKQVGDCALAKLVTVEPTPNDRGVRGRGFSRSSFTKAQTGSNEQQPTPATPIRAEGFLERRYEKRMAKRVTKLQPKIKEAARINASHHGAYNSFGTKKNRLLRNHRTNKSFRRGEIDAYARLQRTQDTDKRDIVIGKDSSQRLADKRVEGANRKIDRLRRQPILGEVRGRRINRAEQTMQDSNRRAAQQRRHQENRRNQLRQAKSQRQQQTQS